MPYLVCWETPLFWQEICFFKSGSEGDGLSFCNFEPLIIKRSWKKLEI